MGTEGKALLTLPARIRDPSRLPGVTRAEHAADRSNARECGDPPRMAAPRRSGQPRFWSGDEVSLQRRSGAMKRRLRRDELTPWCDVHSEVSLNTQRRGLCG